MMQTMAVIGASVILLMTSSVLGSEGSLRFPEVEGKALTGKKFAAPGDLGGRHNLILVAFLREQQEDIDTWIPRGEELEKADSSFTFYEFPVLPEMNSVTRWFIYQGMRSGITSEEARARTVTFHLDKERFMEHLGIESEDYISVFLVDSEGTILWRTAGRWDEEKEAGLKQALKRSPLSEPGAGEGAGEPGADRP
jgi:hypothetical protein